MIIYSDIVEHIVSFRQEIEPEYDVLVKRIGRSIKEVVRIGRRETLHYLLEDADCSVYRIKKLIAEDEKDAEHILARKKEKYMCIAFNNIFYLVIEIQGNKIIAIMRYGF